VVGNPSVSNHTYGELVVLPRAKAQLEKGSAVIVTISPNAPTVEYSSKYSGSGRPTADAVALWVASPRRSIRRDCVAYSETTLDCVDVCVDVGELVAVAVVVTVAVVVMLAEPVSEDDGVFDGDAVCVPPGDVLADGVCELEDVVDGDGVVVDVAVFVAVVDAVAVWLGV